MCLFVLLHIAVLVARRYDVVPAQYVIPLHIGLPTLIAIGAYGLLRIWSRHAGALTVAALLAWACVPLPGSIAWLRTLPEDQASMDASISALRTAGIEACLGPYWDAYRLSYLTLEDGDEDPMRQVLGCSVGYRIAIGPQQGRKVFTLQTIPAWEDDDRFAQVAKESGFSLHAGVAAQMIIKNK